MASTYLTRTPSSAGNRRTFTISDWVKRSAISNANNQVFTSGTYASTQMSQIYFESDDTLNVSDYTASESKSFKVTTNRKFRDTSAWYHIVVAVDTTQGTASNRVKIYINGVQETSFLESNYPSQNFDCAFNLNQIHTVGNRNGAFQEFNGSMSHFHNIDGTAYDPTAFGEYDANGVWKINTSPSVTYGTNGFFILKDGNSVTDQSGNSNNFTVAGGTLTKTEDSPSNVFATGNPLASYWTSATFSNGNNTQVTQNNNYAFNTSTLGFQTGKWYYEAKLVSTAGSDMFGITGRTNANSTTAALGQYADQYVFNSNAGQMRNNNTDTSYASAFNTNGTIVQIAVDMTNLKIHLGLNGVWQNSSNPSNNTGGFTIGAISTTTDGFYFVGIGDYSNTQGTYEYNFGNGYFGTTAVASAGTNASGIGIFEYDVPTGFTALSTKGLNL